MSPPTTHPPGASLAAFALGKLDPADSAPIEDHLAGCEPCRDEVAAVPPDTLVEAVAAAHTLAVARADGATPTFAAAATPSLGAATRGWGDATAGADADVPAALAAHPKYRVLRRLGTGGMGTVWLAQHEVMHREVAVKVIRPDLLARPGAAGRFLREVRAAARLDHPNIVRAHDAEQAGDSCLLAMEYVAGDTLADLVAGGPLPVAEACRAVRDAARGLAHAHAAGLVHRDVKPHNLMRAADGMVKVLDFGLAGVGAGEVVAAGGEGLTGAGMVVGTPDYIAPEQVADPHAADARADIYGLGCTFYHLLAGRPAFPGGSITEKLTAHETRKPDPIPGLAADLAAVLAKMLAKRPADRFQTADEVVAALDAVTASWGARGGRPRRPWRRALAVAAGLLFAAFAALAAVVYKVQRDNEEVVIETDDPDVEVVMLRKGELVRLRDPKSGQTWELNTLTSQLGLVDQPDGLTVGLPGREPFVLRRNGREVFRVTRLPRVVPTPPTDTGAVVLRLVRTTDTGNPVRSLGYTPDGGTLVAGGNDLRLYDRATGSEVHREPRPGNVTAAVALSADGKTAAAASQGTILVFDLDRGRRLKEVPIQSKNSFTFSLALSHDGRTLAYSADGAVRLVDLAADKTDSIPAAQKGSPFGVGFSADGRYLVYTADEMVTILDARTRAVVEKRHIGTVGLSAVSADGQRLVVTSGTGTPGFSAYPLPSGELYREANLPAGVGALAVSADGGRLALGLVNGTAQVWDLRRKKLLASWDVRDPAQRGPFSATAVAITPDGRTLATGAGNTFRVWDLAPASAVTEPTPPAGPGDGWAPLFNGRNLSGWRPVGGTPATWRVENGVLRGAGSTAALVSDRQLADFQLKAEVRVSPGASWALGFRSDPPAGGEAGAGLAAHFVYKGQTNDVVGHMRMETTLTRDGEQLTKYVGNVKPNDWFPVELTVRGDRVNVTIPGGGVGASGVRLPAARGPIVLQLLDPNAVLEARNITVREPGPDAPAPKP